MNGLVPLHPAGEGSRPYVGGDSLFLSWRAQRSKEKHQLPTLLFRQPAERRHASFRVAVSNLPEERAIAERLHDGRLKIGRVFLLQATAISLVAFRTLPKKEFSAARGQFGVVYERITFHCRLRRRMPPEIWFIRGILPVSVTADTRCDDCHHKQCSAECQEQVPRRFAPRNHNSINGRAAIHPFCFYLARKSWANLRPKPRTS
jgi:hypothetical protein